MAIKIVVSAILPNQTGDGSLTFESAFVDTVTNLIANEYTGSIALIDLGTYTPNEIIAAIQNTVFAQAITFGYTITDTDIIWAVPNFYTYAESNIVKQGVFQKIYNNSPSRSIVTGTGATGFQISATRESRVQYSPTMVTTASISGNASDVIVLEICATNSATAANWQEIGRLTNAQALSLAITLQSVQTISGCLVGNIPLGWFAKLRAITSGTVSNSFVSGQEVLI